MSLRHQASSRCLSLIAAVCWFSDFGAMGTGALAQTADEVFNACERAGVAAEQAGGLPAGLLLAIGRVESGRWDATRGRVTPWPWTMNAAGKGQWFASKDAATQIVKAQLDAGTRSIDVGCFQINLQYHPLAFSSLQQAFDPDANARYAARFLLNLYGRSGSWEAATEAYHSADPALGFAYRQQVFSSWLGAAPINATAAAPTLAVVTKPKPPAMPMPLVMAGVQVWSPLPVGTGAMVVAMPPPPRQEPRPFAAMPPLPIVSYRVMPRR